MESKAFKLINVNVYLRSGGIYRLLVYCCYVLLVSSFFSCGGRNNTIPVNVDYLVVPGNEVLPDHTLLTELLEEYRYIIPETTKESLFAYIYKAYVYMDRIYILDKKHQDKILVFDINDGTFIFGVGSRGSGPHEYVGLGNFTMDKSRGNVLILDEFANKVLVYDANSGAFKNCFNLDFTGRDIAYIDENTLAFAGGGQNAERLRLTDMKGKLLGSYVESNDLNWVVPISSFSRGSGNEVIFKTYLNDALYTVTSQGPVVTRFIDFGDDALTPEKFSSYSDSEKNNIEEHLWKYRANMKYYSETDSHIWFIFSDKGAPCCTVFNKETSEVFNYSMFIVNDVVFDQFAPLISASDGAFFIGANDAFSIKENADKYDLSTIPEDIKNISDDNNPVITFLKFK